MFHEKELRRSPGTRLKEEPIPEIGDQLRLMVRHVQNPMGEMELSNTQRELEEREPDRVDVARRAELALQQRDLRRGPS